MKATPFRRLGVMLDMSRNSVMNLPALKEYISLLAEMGYNTVMLYTEDTYEIPEEPYFGHLRGRYSQKELKELVAYCNALGVEVIPCIQTLAHLNAIFRWPRFQSVRDCDDILLVDSEETYAFIEAMFRSCRECFTSRVIHIGMDEAHKVGLGRFLDQHGYENRFEILTRHLRRVCEIAARYGFEPLMWGDMFFRLGNHGRYYNVENPVVPDPATLHLPENISITYWDYYDTEESHFRSLLAAHRRLERPVWYAGGIWTWSGFSPDNAFSIRHAKAALQACRTEEVKDVIFTLWGDNGGECSRFSVLPALFAAAAMAYGEEDLSVIRARFEERFRLSMDAFCLLDMHEERKERIAQEAVTNPAKYLLFNDPFLGVCDSTLTGNERTYYTRLATELEGIASHEGFGSLFAAGALLAKTLSHKADLGALTRAAYQKKDPEQARFLLKEYDLAIASLERFLDAFRANWLKENKPFGLEVQEIRLGGLKERLSSCRKRLALWIDEGVAIPELEEKTLDLQGNGERLNHKALRYPRWAGTATVSVID